MKRRPVTFEVVRQEALVLPNAEEGTAWGFPAFRTSGKLFLCFREDLESVVSRTSFEQRIARLRHDAVHDLLQMAWRAVPQKKPRANPSPRGEGGAKRRVRGSAATDENR